MTRSIIDRLFSTRRSSQQQAEGAKASQRRRLRREIQRGIRFESLEERHLLATVQMTDGAVAIESDGADHNQLSISLDSVGNLVVADNASDVVASPGVDNQSADFGTVVIDAAELATIDRFEIRLGSGDDELTVDLANGNPIPAGGIFYDGGAGGFDTLAIEGQTVAVDTTLYTFVNEHDGGVNIDGSQIDYVGLEPVIDNLNAVNRVFSFLGGAETIVLSDDAVSNDGFSLIDSTLGELVVFSNPTNSLEISAGSGADVVNVDGIDVNGSFSLSIRGDAENDQINVDQIAAGTFTAVTLDGGDGNDEIRGSQGDDLILGGDDRDLIIGGPGADEVDGGAENDIIRWFNGDGSDEIRGGAGSDNVIVVGSSVAPNGDEFTVSADSSGFEVTRADGGAGLGPFNLEVEGVELLELDTSEGDDEVVIEDLTGVADLDSIVVSTGDGNDTIDASALPDLGMQLTLRGGNGDDELFGSQGSDTLIGDGLESIGIRMTNVAPADGTILSPIAVGLSDGNFDQFDAGSIASIEQERLAEDGDAFPLSVQLSLTGNFLENRISTGGPLLPGQTRFFQFDVDPFDPLAQFLSYAAMVVPSNDAFIANEDPQAIPIFDTNGFVIERMGASALVVMGSQVWDAGTEVNDEIPANTVGLAQAAPNTGVAEGGTIALHPGFIGAGGGAPGNILTARPGADFTAAGYQILQIEIFSLHGDDTIQGNGGADNILAGHGQDDIIWNSGDGADLVDGQAPGAAPGDELQIDAAGLPVVVTATTVTVGAQAPVTYASIEDLDFQNASSISVAADAGDNDIDVTATPGGDIQVVIDGGQPIVINATGTLTIDGGDGDDTLNVDLSNGPLPANLLFNGQGNNSTMPGDQITVVGPAMQEVRYNFVNENDGSVEYDFDGGGVDSTITYTGLEPVIDNTDAVNRVFNFTGGAESITLSDDGTAGDNFSQIDSTLGELVVFLNPTNSLTINSGSGADNVFINGSDTATVIPNLIVNGGDEGDFIDATFITGGFTSITLNGDGGNDLINGSALADTINGGPGEDTIGGNAGADIQFGGPDNDTFLWIDGDGPDDNTGGAGIDSFFFTGSVADADVITVDPAAVVGAAGDGTLVGAEVQVTRTAPTAFTIEMLEVEDIGISGAGGNDSITVNDLAPLTLSELNLFGGSGEDTLDAGLLSAGVFSSVFLVGGGDDDLLIGSQGIDGISGDGGNDTLIGGPGDDTQVGGVGMDLFIWNNGDGADDNLGGDDIDTFRFNGAAVADTLTLDPAAVVGAAGDGTLATAEFQLTRTAPSAFTIELAEIENTTVNGLGGDDNVTLNNLAPLALGDLIVNGDDGDDTIDASPLAAGVFTSVTINGGANDDNLSGSQGIDTINGGDGADTILGNGGDDLLNGGDQDDSFTWNNGDGADDVSGDGGTDSFTFNGADGPDDLLSIAPGAGDGSLAATDFHLERTAPSAFFIEFRQLENATVNGLQGNDTFDIADLSTVTDLVDLNLNGNAGDDTFNVTMNTQVRIDIDGGDPVAPATPGDTLNTFAPAELNVYSDKAGRVTFTSSVGGTTTLPLTFVSIETIRALSTGEVNLIGDNNDPAVDQADNFVVIGQDVDGPLGGDADGANELVLAINGVGNIGIADVLDLNVLGDDALLTPSAGNDLDTLEISPFADDTPLGWGIDVFFNEGLPAQTDGDQVDLLIYNTALFGGAISEDIVVRPTSPDNGELIVTNGSFGTPIVDIDYVANTDIIVNDNDGFVHDTDTLTLLGTDGSTTASGNDQVIADFTAAGDAANPIITVNDAVAAAILYRVRSITNFPRVNFALLDGDDEMVLTAVSSIDVDADFGRGDDVGTAESTTANDARVIFRGGEGNDTLIGADPADGSVVNDVLMGEEGNDYLVGGRGRDQVLGGPGNDTIEWVAGDGSDLFEGGTGQADQLVFIANDGDQLLQLYGGGSFSDSLAGFFAGSTLNNSARGIFELNAGQVFLNTGDIESVAISALGGADNIVINNQVDATSGAGSAISTGTDLAATAVTSVEVMAGDGDDSIEIHGTAGNDQIAAANQANLVSIAGASVSVEIHDPVTADRLYIHGQAGDDELKAAAGTEAVIGITLAGDAGDDILSADAVLVGGAGNDTLIGGSGDDTASGDAGDDTYVIHEFNQGGMDSFDGGTGFDTVLLRSGDGDDTITVTEAGGAHTIAINGGGPTVVSAGSAFERLRVDSMDGDDVVTSSGSVVGLEVHLGGGADQLNAAAQLTPVVAWGGSGNDNLIGSDPADGAAVSDILHGGDGDDRLEGGRGRDQFFGGAGNDYFVWVAGDGSDLMEGGTGEADQLVFIANDGANLLQVYGGGLFTETLGGFFPAQTLNNSTRAIFELNAAQVFLNTGDVESIKIDALGGVDNVVINNQTDTNSGAGNAIGRGTDLASSALRAVEVLPGDGDDYIEVHGTGSEDNIDVTGIAPDVHVQGASVAVVVLAATTADRLHVHGQEGDDELKAADGVENLIAITLEGDEGDDYLSADAILIGGSGDDFLQGGAGDDTIFGNEGEDTIVGGAGNDTIDGGPGFDTILIQGTGGNDVIDVIQNAATTLTHTVNGDTQVDTLVAQTVEEARIEAGNGADLIRVNWSDALATNGLIDAVRMTVVGGSDATSDRLAIVDDATDDLVLYRKGQADNSGTVSIGPGNQEPLLTTFNGIERVDFVDEAGAAITNDAAGPQLVVFKHDPFESNDNRFNATYLGSGATINVDPNIDPGAVANPFGLPGDADYYRLVAEQTGTLDFQVTFRQVATLASGRPGLPGDGNLDIQVLDSAGNAIAGFGANDADDDERVRIPAVQGETYYLAVSGAADAINTYNITVVNHAPPTPYGLELLDNPADGTTNPPGTSGNSDTGRSQFDNHTYDTTPTLFLRLDDGIFLFDLPGNGAAATPPDEVIAIPFQAGPAQPATPGYAIAIFDEGNTPPQTGAAPQTPLGFATAVAGQDGVYSFTVPNASALSEGSHFLTARVQMIDPANPQETGFGARSLPLEIIVDTTPPPVSFGSSGIVGDGLHPDSDSGDAGVPATFVDRITNDLTPTFFGRAEANSIVRAYVDLDNSGTLTVADVFIGQAVARPIDGTNQAADGEWEITSTVSMNDPNQLGALGVDGLRRILLTAEDVAGNITDPTNVEVLEIFVDTAGPQVTNVYISNNPAYDLFNLKPNNVNQGPTPRVDSLSIAVQDLPDRTASFLYSAISNVPPLAPIVLTGDHNGIIPIQSVAYVGGPLVAGNPATGDIVLTFVNPLPDDRFTLRLDDSIIDPAGNSLDGENNAAEPVASPAFPTGDRIPGGDFIARFTVDSRPEIATWSQSVVYADINGNFVWDPEGQDNDFTNRDFVYNFGESTDAYFAGDFSPAAAATSSGFDKLGAYGAFSGTYQFFLDTNDDGVGDTVGGMAFQVNAIPVAGDFNAAHPGDEIGAFDGQNWYLDVNGNNNIDVGEQFATNLRGIPLAGDFNGDGSDDLATYNNATGEFQFDLDRNGTIDDTLIYGFDGFGEKPVAGDFNLDGIDDIAMWVPDSEGQVPKEIGEFHILVSDNNNAFPSAVFDDFSPFPLGNDLIAQFGDEFALPIVGNFDPPVGESPVDPLVHREENPLDVNGDGSVSPIDALLVVNVVNQRLEVSPSILRTLNANRPDVNDDGAFSPLDALLVINHLNRPDLPAAEGEGPASDTDYEQAVGSVFADALDGWDLRKRRFW